MKEERNFVSYSQALKLRELGFREECYNYYDADGIMHENSYICNGVFQHVISCQLCNSVNEEENNLCDAPTLWQVQSWLIENKNLFPEPHYFKEGKWTCIMRFLPSPSFEVIDNEGGGFYSYQEALSRGITSCLEFLESKGNQENK